MADTKKYIKKIKMPLSDGKVNELQIKDIEAINSINGYTNEQINKGEVTFANTRIEESDINSLLGIEENEQ